MINKLNILLIFEYIYMQAEQGDRKDTEDQQAAKKNLNSISTKVNINLLIMNKPKNSAKQVEQANQDERCLGYQHIFVQAGGRKKDQGRLATSDESIGSMPHLAGLGDPAHRVQHQANKTLIKVFNSFK